MQNRVPVMIDGGITTGTDVMKALALGADMVFLGRPILWGLAVHGEQGVEEVLNLIRNELVNNMKLCGTPTIKDITKDVVAPESKYIADWMQCFFS